MSNGQQFTECLVGQVIIVDFYFYFIKFIDLTFGSNISFKIKVNIIDLNIFTIVEIIS